MHLKFVNAIASYAHALNLPKEHEHSAYRFHHDMFQSGVERILSVCRSATSDTPSSSWLYRLRGKRRRLTTRRCTSRSHAMSPPQAAPGSKSLGVSPASSASRRRGCASYTSRRRLPCTPRGAPPLRQRSSGRAGTSPIQYTPRTRWRTRRAQARPRWPRAASRGLRSPGAGR